MEIYREQQELSMPKQDLVMYPNQGWLVVYMLFTGLVLVACSGMIVFWPFFWRSLVVVSAFSVILLSWLFWNLVRALFVRQPVLVVTREGIQMHAVPGSGNFFISWPEIETISVIDSFPGLRYLGIHPKNPEQYRSHFKGLKRLRMGSSEPPIRVALIFLDMPIAEFFQQVSQRYAYQIRQERIRLLP
jgi:hypothetical protein